MKKQIFTPALMTVLLVCMFACSKPSVFPPVSRSKVTFKFNAGGNTYQWDGTGENYPLNCLMCGSAIEKYPDYFFLTATEPQNFTNSISSKMNTTALAIGVAPGTRRLLNKKPAYEKNILFFTGSLYNYNRCFL